MEYTEQQKKALNFRKINCIDCDKEIEVCTTGKRCISCSLDSGRKTAMSRYEGRKVAKKLGLEKSCAFCNSTNKPELHHIDRNPRNNKKGNLIYLCFNCHKKLHGKIYNPLFKRFFGILKEERFSMEEIGKLFSTTRQNVNKILKE